uniref:Uncharacterized protein n=1 Tax=Acrobeloides nanus TaxID=290746 RepID=A0A914DUI7_9BILA
MFVMPCDNPRERTICKKSPVQRKEPNNSTTTTSIPSSTNVSALMENYYSRQSTAIECPSTDPLISCPLPTFVCPLPPKQYAVPDTDSSIFCESGWTYFNSTNKCYKVNFNKEAGVAGDRTYKNGVDIVVLESALPIHWTIDPLLACDLLIIHVPYLFV